LSTLQNVIERAWERRSELSPTRADAELRAAVDECLAGIDAGKLRVAEPRDGKWVVNQWLKQAVLLSFRINDNSVVDAGHTKFFDKVPQKFASFDAEQFKRSGVRVVPGGVVRRGAYVAPDVVLMPSFVNIGAYVDQGTMVDTWVTVGSCAQIGKRVHLSGGVGIGGVLEPPEAVPVVVEDDCFVGSRCMIVNGARVRKGSKLGAGLIFTSNTPVIDSETGEEVARGVIPERSVVVQGTRMKEFPGGTFGLPCAYPAPRRSARG